MKKTTMNATEKALTQERGKPSKSRSPRKAEAEAEVSERSIIEELAPLPLGSPALAGLLPPLVSFLHAQNMCVQIVDPDSGEKYGTYGPLPHIIAASLPTDLMSFAARASLLDSVWTFPVRTIGCVVVPVLTHESILKFGICSKYFAHEGYIAAAHISTDLAFRKELACLSTLYKIGIIQIGLGPDATRVILPAEGLPIDSSSGLTFPQLPE